MRNHYGVRGFVSLCVRFWCMLFRLSTSVCGVRGSVSFRVLDFRIIMDKSNGRSRGCPKKWRKEDEKEGKKVVDAKRQPLEAKPIKLVGRYVLKEFPKNGIFLGKVVYYDIDLCMMNYEDRDFEDLESGEIRPILIRDEGFDAGLVKRRTKLEKVVAKNSVKGADVAEKVSGKSDKEESAAGVTAPNELNGELSMEIDKEEDDGADAETSSESVPDVEHHLCRHCCSCRCHRELLVCRSRASPIFFLFMDSSFSTQLFLHSFLFGRVCWLFELSCLQYVV
ncbi:DDT domain-containing protein PTM [Trifolium repens]|nr:DDT domain-containing protein PTM [Trifolium repens]